MKKIYALFISLFLILSLSITVSATELTYNNPITDDSTIVDDFKVLGLEISDYYIPESYDYYKWYVVAMSESYLSDNSIQTYFYLYNPMGLNDVETFEIKYTLNSVSKSCYLGFKDFDGRYGLLKTKGFAYGYNYSDNIKISEITCKYSIEDPSTSGETIDVFETYISTFESVNKHDSNNNNISFDLSFNSFLVIENPKVVEVEVYQDNNFINIWNTIFTGDSDQLLLYFYNFDFPDHIKVDSVEYAKFIYDYLDITESYRMIYNGSTINHVKNEVRSSVVNEYNNETKTVRVNEYSVELAFPNFYLGNRFDDPNFALKENINTGDLDSFDMDCSILIDSTYKIENHQYNYNDEGMYLSTDFSAKYTTLDKVEMIELHYINDGILYKCQVSSPPVDNDDFEHIDSNPVPEKSFWQKLCEWFFRNLPYSIILIFVIFVALAVVIPVIIVLAPYLIKFIIWLFKIIIRIILLPVKMIASLFSNDE